MRPAGVRYGAFRGGSGVGFRALVAGSSPGSEITLGILRDGQPLTLKVRLIEQPGGAASGATGRPSSESTLRGITAQELTPSIRDQLGLSPQTRGVVISDLEQDSPAAQQGLQPGDVIESINRQPVRSLQDFDRLAAQATGDTLLRVNRQGASAFVVGRIVGLGVLLELQLAESGQGTSHWRSK